LKQIRRHFTYANVMSSLAVFMILGGATAFAAVKKVGPNQIKANSIKTGKIVKEAVTAGKIKKAAVNESRLAKSAVTTNKLADNAVTTPKIADDAVIGAKVNESTLGEVPSAAKATTAANLTGQANIYARLAAGQTQTLLTYGPLSLEGQCLSNDGGQDRVRLLAQTTVNGSILDGSDDKTGPTEFLDVGLAATDRVLEETSIATGQTRVNSEIDEGIVMAPSGQAILANSEGIALGLNYSGSACLIVGVVNTLG
jgi:hypothetical protein